MHGQSIHSITSAASSPFSSISRSTPATMMRHLRFFFSPLCQSGPPLSYLSFGSRSGSRYSRSHHVCEMKMTIFPSSLRYSTSQPLRRASSRHALVDFGMRPSWTKKRKGMSSIGVRYSSSTFSAGSSGSCPTGTRFAFFAGVGLA